MSFRINTNIASLEAQDYLRVNSEYQAKTINRVTSGLRIISSGDDAAGLAIANSLRSDQAVLGQGIRNANDGLSTLQTIDGGMNNISKLLDRARTLATQSASGTFTGDRNVLNSEFQSLIIEIDRQAQAIGLNTAGDFARTLSVFIGGGKASGGTTAIQNGAASVDLSSSTVDAKSLGLKGAAAVGTTATDIGPSSTTSVALILANATNTGSEVVSGYSDFYFQGAGFAGANKSKVSVNLASVTDTATLVTAINYAIIAAGGGGSQYATAFANANIQASTTTDSLGRKQLTFGSPSAAFQVQAGDRVANALMGNFSATVVGKDLAYTNAGTGVTVVTGSTLTEKTIVRIQGGGLDGPVDITVGASGDDIQAALSSLSSQVANNAALKAAGITLNGGAALVAGTTTLSFSSKRGEGFTVSTAGDVSNLMKLGTYRNSVLTGTSFEYTSTTAPSAYSAVAAGLVTIEFSIAGGAATSISYTGTAADVIGVTVIGLNNQVLLNATLAAAGISFSNSAGKLKIDSANGTAFRINVTGDAFTNIGWGATDGAAGNATLTATAADATNNVHTNAGGQYATGAYAYSPMVFGQDTQTLTFTAVDSSGTNHTRAIVLRNDGTARNGRSLDEAIATINTSLLASNDTTLQKIMAVKEYNTSTTVDNIRFVSSGNFGVGLGTSGTGAAYGIGTAGQQGAVLTSTLQAGGSTSDISTQSAAESVVGALATAVASLGSAQAVVGKGQNQFGYAVNLAQSQLTNIAAAESRIRDADLAQEAANLTRAQIILQAGIAAMAQANSAPEAVLALLRA